MKNIFIGNLDSETTTDTIRSLFAPLGTVRRLKLMTHPATGLSRGFAFVWMREVEAGPAIAALDGRVVDGNAISVRLGRPQLRDGKGAPQRDGSIASDARAGERQM
jgi:RNA recognition motif-containing protein